MPSKYLEDSFKFTNSRLSPLLLSQAVTERYCGYNIHTRQPLNILKAEKCRSICQLPYSQNKPDWMHCLKETLLLLTSMHKKSKQLLSLVCARTSACNMEPCMVQFQSLKALMVWKRLQYCWYMWHANKRNSWTHFSGKSFPLLWCFLAVNS